MKKHTKKIITLAIFILSVLVASFLFIKLNKSRERTLINHSKKSFSIILDLTANMVSSGYFQWDDMYEAFTENDTEYILELFSEIYEMSDYIESINIINKNNHDDELFFIGRSDNKLFIDFNIFDGNLDNVYTPKIVRIIIDKDKILKDIQFNNNFSFSIYGDYEFLYGFFLSSLKPDLYFFQIISAITIGLFLLFITNYIFYGHANYFYETRGLEKIIFLFEHTDIYSANHSKHVSTIAYFLGKNIGLHGKKLKDLKVAALLHDIGKISIPKEVLNKKGKLTDDEFEIIKEHPVLSYNIIKSFEELSHLGIFIKHHHEKMDGTGYPSGLQGDEIPIESRVIAIADIFEALIGKRPYREPLDPAEAIRFMNTMSLDLRILKVLQDNLDEVCRAIHKD